MSIDRRDLNVDKVSDNMNLLDGHYSDAVENANNLRKLFPSSKFDLCPLISDTLGTYSSQAPTSNNPEFQQRVVQECDAFKDNTLAFSVILARLAADKGLANYDRRNELETLLKAYVNLHKRVLAYIYKLIADIPVLGPILGPSRLSSYFIYRYF